MLIRRVQLIGELRACSFPTCGVGGRQAGAETLGSASETGDYSFANIGGASVTFGQPRSMETAAETTTLEASVSCYAPGFLHPCPFPL